MANLEAISYINLGDGNHPIDAVTVGGKTVPDVSDFITKSVNDLTNYYLKTETYTQEEVNTLIGNILQFHYEIAASTSAVSTPENNVLYLIGPTGDGEDKYEEYVYPNSTAGWTKIGDTTIDLTDYVSIDMLNETLEDYKTSSEIEEIELIIAAALNDLNERLIYIEEDFAQGVSGQIYNVEESISSLDSRVSTLETNASSYLTSEADPVFLSSPAGSITNADISSWNAKQDALVYDSIPTENSDNLVKSGVLYSVLTRTEYITATAINDLNDRISDLESVDLSLSYVTISQYNDDEFVFATAINDLNDRIMVLESGSSSDIITAITVNGVGVSVSGGVASISVSIPAAVTSTTVASWGFLSSESDPVFMSSAAASITASDIANWNSKTSNTGTLTGVKVNNISGTISGGVASVSLTLDNISDGSTRKMADYVTYASYDDDQEVIAAAFNDLNGRMSTVESSALNAVIFNGVSASVSNGVASISAPVDIELIDVGIISSFSNASFPSGTFNTANQAIKDGKTVIIRTSDGEYYNDWHTFTIVEDDSITLFNENYNESITLHSDDTVSVYSEDGFVRKNQLVTESTVAGWGFTKNSGTLTSESDPVFMSSVAASITASNISDWNSKISGVMFNGTAASVSNGVVSISAKEGDFVIDLPYGWQPEYGYTGGYVNLPTGTYNAALSAFNSGRRVIVRSAPGMEQTDAIVYAEMVYNVTNDDAWVGLYFAPIQETNQYYNYSFHLYDDDQIQAQRLAVPISNIIFNGTTVSKNYDETIVSISETDPVFSASPAASITASNISSWNAKQNALTYDSIPTYNSDNLVKSGALYNIFEENEYVVSTALNDLNDRVSAVGNAKIFYGTCSTAADSTTKVVDCSAFTSEELVQGALIFVTFAEQNAGAVGSLKLDVNGTGAKKLQKQSNYSTTNLANVSELRAGSTYLFQYNTTVASTGYWICMTLDYNTTYAGMSEASAIAGTGTSTSLVSPAVLKAAITTHAVPKTGGTMNDNAILEFQDSDGYYFTQISHNGITLINGEDLFGSRITSEAITLGRWNGGDFDYPYTVTTYTNIVKYVDSSTNYTYTYPSKSGTFAMTDDIPAAVTSTTVASWGFLSSESDPVFASSVAASISAADIANWNSKTSNTGTVTGSSLTADKIVLGAGNSAIKNSTYGITTNAPSSGSTNDTIPTSSAVYSAITTALTSVLKYKGTAANNASLPATHAVGDVYVVSTAGTFAGKACEVGDYIICKTSGTSANDSHWDVVNGENQVDNKSASLAAAGSSATIATVDGTNITISTPSTWTGVDKTGTITGISMNGSSKGTSGNVDLGTVVTAVSFNGTAASISNGVASITATIPTVNNTTITIQKNGTTAGTFTTNAASASTVNISVNELPTVTSAQNGQVLQVVNGSWTLVTPVSIYSGTSNPDSSQGTNGDLYLQTS